jgi:adenine-specific DNA-methyltransferase
MNQNVQRLNYIGSKFKLLEWIDSTIKEKTGWNNFENKNIADLFAGTGIISLYFRNLGANITANDAELYSYIITTAFVCSSYNDKIQSIIYNLNNENEGIIGYVTKQYSPYDSNDRKFFTIENAMKIDYMRTQIEELKNELSENEYIFLLASLIISADAVSNVPAVYGCYLKNFKDKAKKNIILKPIHKNIYQNETSLVFNYDVMSNQMFEILQNTLFDAVYIDPPYNERQYSKNYFPLNIIAKTPEQLQNEPPLKGKTGIPTDCFISSFCRKNNNVQQSFITLLKNINSKWIFISYNSESILTKDEMTNILQEFGDVTVVEREYKRFKSFQYNKDVCIKEYLFCLFKDE